MPLSGLKKLVRAGSMTALGAVLAACATPTVIRDETIQFVSAGEAAVAESKAYLEEIGTAHRNVVRTIVVDHAECPLGPNVVLRRRIAESLVASAPNPLEIRGGGILPDISLNCQKAFKDNNASTDMCISADAGLCRREIVAKAPADERRNLRLQYGIDFTTAPFVRARLAASYELVEVVSEYVNVLSGIATRPKDAKSSADRLDGLLGRLNLLACRIDSLSANADAGKCAKDAPGEGNLATNLTAAIDADLKVSLQAAGALYDLIKSIHADVVAARGIAETLRTKGAEFETAVIALSADIDAKRQVYFAQFGMEAAEQIQQLWNAPGSRLSPEERAALFDRFWIAEDAVNALMSSPAAPTRMLDALLASHQVLVALAVDGVKTDAQRDAIADIEKDRLKQFFTLGAKFVASLKLL
jgi:hypothetical protein